MTTGLKMDSGKVTMRMVLYTQRIYENGFWEGLWVDHYDDGSIRSKGFYRNGKLIE